MAEKRSAHSNPQSAAKQKAERTRILTLLGGGAFLIFLVQKLTAPAVPPSDGINEYTFQPEPRPPAADASQPMFDLGASSGALGPAASSAPAPTAQAASCASLQQFANYEYARRFREGKLDELMNFSGFEAQQVSASAEGVLSCSGGEFTRRGPNGIRSCRNVLINYDTRSNTLSYNVQYRYLESGLVAQCSEQNSAARR